VNRAAGASSSGSCASESAAFLPRAPRAPGIALAGGIRGLLHRPLGLGVAACDCCSGTVWPRGPRPRQRVRGRGEIALSGGGGGIGVLRVVLVPFRLAPLQVFGVPGERGELAFERGRLNSS